MQGLVQALQSYEEITHISLKFFSKSNVGLFKQTASKHPVSQFFPANMIFLEEQSLGYNKICMGFNPRGGARGPLSAPRLIVIIAIVENYTLQGSVMMQ